MVHHDWRHNQLLMESMMKNVHKNSILLVALVGIVLSEPIYAEEVGIAGASNPDAMGSHPSKPSHLLQLGEAILFKEKITTNAKGSLQVSFTDGSGMAIGPNASIVIDEYVYDPNKGTAAMGASLVKGALRFVGGAISHDKGVNITTPVATIGVRGGIATLSYTPSTGTLDVVHHFGVTTITTPGGTITITQKDFKITINSSGQVIEGTISNLAAFNTLLNSLMSQNSQTGGAITLPSDALMSRNGIELPRPGQPLLNIELPQLAGEAPGANLCLGGYCNTGL